MRPSLIWVLALVIIIIALESLVMAFDIPLKCDRGGYVGSAAVPLGCGIPLKEGQAKSTDVLAIEAMGKGLVPAQFEVRTRYESGSILWLWADFIGSPAEQYKLVFGRKNPAASLSDISVRKTANSIEINNGVLELRWDKQYAAPVRVSYVENKAPRMIAVGDGGGIYLIDNRDRKAVLGGKTGELDWKIETQGKVRLVLRCEGYYTTQDGDQVARAIVRYHIYRDRPDVKLEHTFIVTRDNDEVWYKEIGVSLPLKSEGRSKAHFCDAKGKFYTAELEAGDEAWIFQKEYPVYARNEYICEMGTGKKAKGRTTESAGWSALGNGSAGLMLSVRDFAPQFPKEFCAYNGQLTAKLWSGRDKRLLDFHPKTMAADWWKEWVDYANVSAHNQKVPEAQPENIRSGKNNPSCVGVARTHTLYFTYFFGEVKPDKCKALDNYFQKPALVYPDPRWICHVDPRAFWQTAAKGEGGKKYEDIEAFISFWFDQFMMPLDCFRHTGFYDWGWNPLLRYFKITEGNKVRIYPDWFRLNFSNIYGLSKFLIIGWARSGERRYLDAACHFTRYTSDYKFIHWDGGRDQKAKGQIAWGFNHCLPTWWGKGTLTYGVDGDIVSPLALLYLLRDERWAKDTLLLYRDQMMAFEITRLTDGGHPNVPLNHLMGVYRAFPSPELKAKIKALFEGFTDPEGPGGMSCAWFAPGDGRHPNNYELYKINMKALSVMEYCDLFGYERRSVKVLEKATRAACIAATHNYFAEDSGGKSAREWMEEKVKAGVIGPEIVSACTYQDYYGATAAIAYKHTQSRDFRDVAKGQLEAIRSFWTTYQRLPPEQRITAKFKEPGAAPKTTAYNAFIKGSQDRYPFYFGPQNSGTVFLALPTVIWMLNDFKEPEWK